jgi:iron-sulfur cluster assembly accessory protein
MVALTDSAVTAIRQVMETAETPAAGLRIMAESGGCSGFRYKMGLDSRIQDDDTVLQLNGITVLIDPLSQPALEGVQVDFVDSLDGSGFVIENPNSRTGCSACHSRTC